MNNIEVLNSAKELLKKIDLALSSDDNKITVGNEDWAVVSSAISALEAQEKAKGVLPEKVFNILYGEALATSDITDLEQLTNHRNYCVKKALDRCTPIVAKLIKERDRLEQSNRMFKEQNCNLIASRNKLQAELSRIKGNGIYALGTTGDFTDSMGNIYKKT